MSESRLAVGYIAGVHGIAGGLRVRLFDEASRAIEPGRTIELWRDAACVTTAQVRAAARVPGKEAVLRVQLEGIDRREAAEELKGCELRVERELLPELDDDEFYLVDAIGAQVVEPIAQGSDEMRPLGRVTGVSSNGVQDLFEIEWIAPDGERHAWLLPVLPQFVIDVGADRVVVEVPPGFVPEALEAQR